MAVPVLPHSPSTGLPIALLVCIVAAVTIFVVLMVIAFCYYLVRRRRHRELRDRARRSAIHFAPTSDRFKAPSPPHEHHFPAVHPCNLAPPVLPQLRFHSPITPSRPSLPVQSKQDNVLPPLPLRFSGTDREQKHLVVPVSSFSAHKDHLRRVPLERLPSDLTIQTEHAHDDDDERKRKRVVNEYFAADVNQRSGELHVQTGRWRDSTRIKTILRSDTSSINLAAMRTFPLDDLFPPPPPPSPPPLGRGRSHDPWDRASKEDARLAGPSSNPHRTPHLGLQGRHGIMPAPLAPVARKPGWV
ncbi:hypothetical protein MMC07_007238 [Pseudocyphellaria aurata]|nr:hypothetical protein [Pseudocyphellaria aurata]